MKWICVFFLIGLIGIGLCQAQNIKFKTYQVEDGLSNNSVNDFENDATGGLWIATWDGLNYFDGSNFQVYKHKPGDPKSLPGNFIFNLLIDKQNVLWVKSTSQSISYMQGEDFVNFYFESEVGDFGLDLNGELFIVLEGETYSFSTGEFKPCNSCVIADKGTQALKDLLIKKYPEVEINKVLTDDLGQVWYATIKNGLFVLPPENPDGPGPTFYNYTSDAFYPYSINSNEIYTIHEDVFGNVWIGYKDGGISMAYSNSGQIFSVYRHPVKNPAIPEETVRAITQGDGDQIWLGYYNSGLFVSEVGQETFQKYFLSQAKNNRDWDRIRSLFTDHSGSVWVGTYAGIARIDSDKQVRYFSAEDNALIPNNRNYNFIETDDRASLWVACWGGLAKYSFNSDEFVPFEGQEKLVPYHIRHVLESDGKLYLATESNGVVIWDKGELSFLGESDGLLNSSVFSFEKDEDTGNIWIATMGGINIYHPDRGIFFKITEKEGLVSQLVYGILSSKDHMWVSTTNGISRISKEDFQVRTLPPNEGWQGAEFSEGGFYKNERGVLFFGGIDGLNYFHPQQLLIEDELPLLGIVKPEPDLWTAQLKEARLDLKVRRVAFTQNPQNKIQYQLAPLRTEWTDLGDDFRIVESSLAPGEYTFILRNSLEENPALYAAFGFIIPRPFWKSPVPWLIIGILLVVALLIWRNRNTKIQRQNLLKKVAERTELIEKQKLELQKINYDLDIKNREISDQKAELLAIHNRHKDSDFEIEQFKNYMLGQFKLPLSELKENIEQLNTKSRARKEGVLQQVNEIMSQVREWDRVSMLEHSQGYGNSLTILTPLVKDVFQHIKPKLKQYQIGFEEKYQLRENWVELDVIGFKLFWQYLIREMMKYLGENASLAVYATSNTDTIQVQLKISSKLLTSNLDEIIKYSPYLKAAYSLLQKLSGVISYHTDDKILYVSTSIPFNEPAKQIQNNPVGYWKYINLNNELDPDKHHVVLLGKKYESDSLLKIIHNAEFDIIVEEDVHLVIEAIRNARINALIIYNEKMSQSIIELVEAIHATSKSDNHIPVVYIYDTIEPGFQDELMDLGIETFIQLPASSRFILKNISTQLHNIKRLKKELKTFDFLQDETLEFSSPTEKLVREGMMIINEQLSNGNFKVESLSEALRVSKIKCYRAFKEVLNTSPSDVMMSLRIEKAQQLLSKNKMNVSEVSFACGFNDPKYFSKMFKKYTGFSPKNFYKSG